MNLGKFLLADVQYGFSIIISCYWNYFFVLRPFLFLINWRPIGCQPVIVSLYIGTILAIVNRNMPPESKVIWLFVCKHCACFGFFKLSDVIGESGAFPKKKFSSWKMDSMKFPEDNS